MKSINLKECPEQSFKDMDIIDKQIYSRVGDRFYDLAFKDYVYIIDSQKICKLAKSFKDMMWERAPIFHRFHVLMESEIYKELKHRIIEDDKNKNHSNDAMIQELYKAIVNVLVLYDRQLNKQIYITCCGWKHTL